MGNNPSTTHRRVQPSLFNSFKYNRLSSSSYSENQQPLLANNHDENVEQLKRETEANRKKNESLEKRNASLEKNMRERKAAITPKKEPTSNIETRVATLEKQVAQLKPTISFFWEELKSTNSRLESASSQPAISVPSGTESETTQLKKKVEKLERRLMTLELDNSARKKQDKEIAAQKIAELEKQLVELTSIHQTRNTTSAESDCLVTSMEQEFGNTGYDSTNDLVGCLVVLIFLVAVLIGLNM